MTTEDDEFIARLRATFKAEAEELLQAISSLLLALEKSPAPDRAAVLIENVFREAHTLKGAARAVDLPDIEVICQQMEEVFSSWKRRQSIPSPNAFDSLHRAVDMMRALLPSAEKKQVLLRQEESALIQRLDLLQSKIPPPASRAGTASPPAPLLPAAALPSSNPSIEGDRPAGAETVRIAIHKLDSQLLKAESLLVFKSIAAQHVNEFREMTTRLEQWERQWSKVASEARTLRQTLEQNDKTTVAASAAMVNFLNWNCEFLRTLESKVHTFTARAQNDRHDVGKQVDDLLEDSKKLLMLPFSTMANQFPRLVRDLCRDQNKEAELVIRGGEVEIDKRILEEMKDALIHILRNCVDHGVEPPARRKEMNKPPRATITVAAAPVNGNKVEILVSDDGAGVDLRGVKESAVRHGIVSEPNARDLQEADALRLVFHSEVSTSPAVTTISGRGLGMAIAHAKTEQLGGRVSIESQRGAGTTLRMLLPLTMATFRGLLVAVGDTIFVVPSAHVERVLRVRPQDIQTVENREAIRWQEKVVSLVRLNSILELKTPAEEGPGPGYLPVVIVHSADQCVAVVVDQILHEEEVLVKPFRKPLVRVRNIAGATVLGSGAVAPVLNVSDLLQSARVAGAAPVATAFEKRTGLKVSKKVLVAEDSITSRMLLKGILESAGYQVRTAVDGVDAFTAMREEEFDLIVSDVEMPRMNGFDLTARIRSDKRLSELPVVLITALESREQRERGIDAGANAYVVKSSFDQQNLLEVVRRLT